MNNLAASLAQQVVPPEPNLPPPPRKELVAAARVWAERALELAASIEPPERNEECDQGCAVATSNLAEFAEMVGDVGGARERFEEAVSLANAIGFQEGVVVASEGLRRLDEGASGRGKAKKSRGWWG